MSIYSDRDIATKHNVDFVVSPFDSRRITPLGYDLSAEHALLITFGGQATIVSLKKFEMPARSMAVLIAKEYVWLSTRLVGILHSRGSLSARGLVLNSTTVDPQWSGRMIFCIHNASPFSVEVDLGDPVITLVLNPIHNEPRNPPATSPLRVIEDHYKGRLPEGIVDKFISSASDLASPENSRFLAATHKASAKGWIGRKISVITGNVKLYPARVITKLLVALSAAATFVLILERIVLLYLDHLKP